MQIESSMNYEREINHIRNNMKIRDERFCELEDEYHKLDKRVDYLEKHNGMMLLAIQEQVKEMAGDIIKIKDFLANKEGYKTAMRTFCICIGSFISMLTALGLHEHIFSFLGFK